MTDVCKNCGRPIWPAGALSTPHMVYCWRENGHECEAYAVGYMRGRSDGIDDGVRIAKTSAVIRHHMKWPEGEWTNIDWSNVDAEATKAKGQAR